MPFMHDSPVLSKSQNPSHEAGISSRRRSEHHEADVVIIGAGILGCAAAIALANQGRSVILLEKSLKEPDRIVGELLQPGGYAALQKLGLADCLEGIDAIPVHGYAIFHEGEHVKLPYSYDLSTPTSATSSIEKPPSRPKRPEGRSFHHGRFVNRLRQHAKACANITIVETTATELVRSEYTGQILGTECKTAGQQDYYFGHLTIAADGYASKFRKQFISTSPVSKSKFWALELIDADLPFPNHGHVILAESALTLLYQIGTHETRALIDIPEGLASASSASGGSIKSHIRDAVLPALPASVRPAFVDALDRDRLRSMPNSWLPPTVNKTPGLILLGDAMNMRHPLTGGGMTVALNDAVLLSELLNPAVVPSLTDTTHVISQMNTFHWQRKHLTSIINVMAQALYNLFAADDAQLRLLRTGCFKYLGHEGPRQDGPTGLLGGIIRRPLVLIYHFFSVALYAIWLYISSASVVVMPYRAVMSIGIFWKACLVIGPFLISEMKG